MMDNSSENTRPHRTTTTTTTTTTASLFICFTSRLSSSSSTTSMKLSSTSPGRTSRDPPSSLSTSLSRRLKTNGSLRGGQSPMFPPSGPKRRGFENPEPSSPKVTCIGQVRVKTKKQGNKIKTLSSRRKKRNLTSLGGVNNSNSNSHQQQQEGPRWVHLPLTICEALSCFSPCRPPSCLRWGKRKVMLVSLNNEDGREREVEEVSDYPGVRASFCAPGLMLGDQLEEVRERISLRRHVGEEEEEEEMFGGGKLCEGGLGGGRLSVCVPPKNALLLMRSRSDPVRVSALAARFWESPAAGKCVEEEGDDCEKDEEGDGVVEEGEVVNVLGLGLIMEGEKVGEVEKLGLMEVCEEEKEGEAEPDAGVEVEQGQGGENPQGGKLEVNEEMLQEADEEENQGVEAANQENEEVEEANKENQETEENREALADPASFETEDGLVEKREESHFPSVLPVHSCSQDVEVYDGLLEKEEEEETEEATLDEEEENAHEEMEAQDSALKVEKEEQEETVTQERSESEQTLKEEGIISSAEREEKQEQKVSPLLPDCLLLMRCEPKLSMEVSKETWVCTTDFIRWLPERPQPKALTDGRDEPKKKKRVGSTDTTNQYQPSRSSCSLPAAVAGRASMAARVVNINAAAVAYEPLGLTRCKSEPNRTAAAKLKPETCFWKNRRLEPHSRAAVGVGAAGVGF